MKETGCLGNGLRIVPQPKLQAIAAEKSEGDAKADEIVQRMKAMRLPEIEFAPPKTIVDAIEFFRSAWKKNVSAEIPAEKRGFNFVLDTDPEASAPTLPMIKAADISFYDALKIICESVDYEFEINYEADLAKAIVTIKPCTGSARCGSIAKYTVHL